ncbi:MAG: glycosyltransferase family 2 protein [Bacteroidia bacterium]
MKVSVIIPVYNREKELLRAINSVLNQTIQDFEILVIDDCSTVPLQALLNVLNDQRIKYHKLEVKGNANVCRNVGIKTALGDYVAMLDSDDEWLPMHLENKISTLEQRSADGIFGSCRIDNGIRMLDKISRPFHHNEKMVNYLLSDGMAPTPTHVYKTACARQILWDESLVRHQDWDFSVRFSEKFSFIPSYDITCIVYWKAGERREEHFDSLIKFIDANKKEITPRLYFEYHALFYRNICDRKDVDQKYKKHYKREVLKNIDVLSLRDYLSTFGGNRGKLYRFKLRMEFIAKVLFKN